MYDTVLPQKFGSHRMIGSETHTIYRHSLKAIVNFEYDGLATNIYD